MTDLPHDRNDPNDPNDPNGARDEAQPPTGDQPPPADTPPPPGSPTPPPQAQWPQQQAGTSGTSGMTGSEQRNWAVGAHIGALATSVLTGLAILAPLVVYLAKKDQDVFVREHAREALNFQLTWLIGGIVATIIGVVVTIVTVGIALIVLVPAGIGFAIAWVVFMVKASMAASSGEYYRYPLTIRMIS